MLNQTLGQAIPLEYRVQREPPKHHGFQSWNVPIVAFLPATNFHLIGQQDFE